MTVTYPNGGQTFGPDQEVVVAWNAQDDVGVVQARVYFVVGGTEHLVAEGAFHDAYTFVWNDHFAGQPGPRRAASASSSSTARSTRPSTRPTAT